MNLLDAWKGYDGFKLILLTSWSGKAGGCESKIGENPSDADGKKHQVNPQFCIFCVHIYIYTYTLFTLVFFKCHYIYINIFCIHYIYIYIQTHFIFYTNVCVSLNFASLHFSFPWTWLQVCQRSEGRCRMPSCGQSCPPATCLLASSTWGWGFMQIIILPSLGGGNSNIFFNFSPRKLGKIPILTSIFQMGWFNHQLVLV